MLDLNRIDWGEQVDLVRAPALIQTIMALRPQCIDQEAYKALWEDLKQLSNLPTTDLHLN